MSDTQPTPGLKRLGPRCAVDDCRGPAVSEGLCGGHAPPPTRWVPPPTDPDAPELVSLVYAVPVPTPEAVPPTREERREAAKLARKKRGVKRYADRKAAGKCVRCDAPVPVKANGERPTKCETCQAKPRPALTETQKLAEKKRTGERYEALRAAGACVQCTKPVEPRADGTHPTNCPACASKGTKRTLARRAVFLAAGKCGNCGGIPRTLIKSGKPGTDCEKCYRSQEKHERRRKKSRNLARVAPVE